VLRIFILGPFRSLDNSKRDFNRLTTVRKHLTELGYDAFLSIDRDTADKVDLRKLSPRQKTLKLVRFADLNLFIFTKTGIRNGLVAELTEVQTRYPGLAWKHVVLLENDLELSSILDESQGGVMSLGPLKQMVFDNDGELLEAAEQVAYNYTLARATGSRRQDPVIGRDCLPLHSSRCVCLGARRGRVQACRSDRFRALSRTRPCTPHPPNPYSQT